MLIIMLLANYYITTMVTVKLITANTTAINFPATIFIPLLRYYSYHYYCIAVLPITTVSSKQTVRSNLFHYLSETPPLMPLLPRNMMHRAHPPPHYNFYLSRNSTTNAVATTRPPADPPVPTRRRASRPQKEKGSPGCGLC